MRKASKRITSGIMALSMVLAAVPFQPITQAAANWTALVANAETDGNAEAVAAPSISYIPGNGRVKLSWTAVEGAEKYAVYGYVGGKWQALAQGTSTSYIMNDLTAGKNYKVAVAYKADGKWNYDTSNVITVTPNAAKPAYPVVQSQLQNGQFRLKWTAVENAEGYAVAVHTQTGWKIIKTTDADVLNYTSPAGNTPGGTYFVAVAPKINGEWDISNINKNKVKIVVHDTSYDDCKIGLICLHDENSSYDNIFISSLNEAKKTLGLYDDQIVIRRNVPEGEACSAVIDELIEAGCNIIIADSFGHERFLLEAAKANPDVQFCHATGTLAHTEEVENFHDAFASIYEARYLAGIAAGMKLNEMIENGDITEDEAELGYVGAFTYAEVISGYTSFYLGAKSVCPTATMKVKFTGSWYDEEAERNAAYELIEDGCVIISQHADSMGAPSACEESGVPNISYNGSNLESCPNTFIISSKIDWTPYYIYIAESLISGEELAPDWVGTHLTDSIKLTEINENAAADGTKEAIQDVLGKMYSGTFNVFDTSTFTVDGETLTSYLADVDTDDDFTPDTEVIFDGYFHESEFRSAPYFDIRIDGITLLNEMY